jgi:hypothetical protein
MDVRLHEVGVGVVGLDLLPALSRDLGGDIFVKCSIWVVNLLISVICCALMKDRDLLVVWCSTVSASGESLACPVNAASGVCPARSDDAELSSAACIAGKMHGHSCGAKCISESIALAALIVCLQTASTVPFAHGQYAVVK